MSGCLENSVRENCMSFQGDSQYLNGSEPLGLFLLSLTAIFCLTTLSLYMQISDFYADGR